MHLLVFLLFIGIFTLAGYKPTTETPTQAGELKSLSDCVTFDSLKIGTKFNVPNTIIDPAADIAVLPFQWSNLTYTNGGYVQVVDNMPTRPGDNSVFINNVNLGFDVGKNECIRFDYCDKGGNVNLVINNQVGNKDDLISFNGTTMGAVDVSVTQDSDNCGEVTLKGTFDTFNFQNQQNISFAIGGQELFVDNICLCK